VLARLKLIEESSVDVSSLTKGTLPPPRIIGANGIPARVSETTWASRAIAATAPVTVTNGDGVDGNPTIGLSMPYVAATKTTVFTASGTFTPDSKMMWCEVAAWGGGGAGGGAQTTAAGQSAVGAGGHCGAYAFGIFTLADIGASRTVTIGAGGTGVAGGTGNTGGETSLSSLLVAAGGPGGGPSGSLAGLRTGTVAATVQSSVGNIRGWTSPGTNGASDSAGSVHGGNGAPTVLGGVGLGHRSTGGASGNGNAASANTGSGGGGGGNTPSQGTARSGGAGGSGLMIIKEYLRP
jgi:hypothetical protein